MNNTPITNGANGRAEGGRFAKGNAGGPGNPHIQAVSRWRTALVDAVSEDDIRAVLESLVSKAKKGERWAVTELLNRCLGRPVSAILPETDQEDTRIFVTYSIPEMPVD